MSYRFFCVRVVFDSVFIAALLAVALFYGCAGWTVNGLRADNFRGADAAQVVTMAGGAIASMAVHTAGHILYLETAGKEWHIDGLYEICDGKLSGSQRQWFGRAGFVAQLAVGGAVELVWPDSHFATGYHIGTAIETWTYPLLHRRDGDGHDFEMIDSGGGHGDAEWVIYSAAAGALLFDRQGGDR